MAGPVINSKSLKGTSPMANQKKNGSQLLTVAQAEALVTAALNAYHTEIVLPLLAEKEDKSVKPSPIIRLT